MPSTLNSSELSPLTNVYKWTHYSKAHKKLAMLSNGKCMTTWWKRLSIFPRF
jgi:hypothetical protein